VGQKIREPPSTQQLLEERIEGTKENSAPSPTRLKRHKKRRNVGFTMQATRNSCPQENS
jgi:hypothetical protein